MVVVFLLRGLHNEAGNTKFRNVRQYIAHMGHVGAPGVSVWQVRVSRYLCIMSNSHGIPQGSLEGI